MANTTYTPELGELICERIAEGQSLRQIALHPGMPTVSTMMRWAALGDAGDKRYTDFSEQYVRAMAARADYMGEQIIDIADDSTGDTFVDDDGNERVNFDNIQRSKLRIETHKWLMGKMKPKKYGDKITNEHIGPNGGPIQTQDLTVSPKEAKAISQALDDEC
jgi:hypothetical protein